MGNTTLTSRFINFHTRAAYNTFKAGAGNTISDQSIVFITDPDASQRDILTHGISMIGGVPRISSYSVDGKVPYVSVSGAANLNFISGNSVALSADEKGVKISCDLPIEKGTGVASLKANSGNSAKVPRLLRKVSERKHCMMQNMQAESLTYRITMPISSQMTTLMAQQEQHIPCTQQEAALLIPTGKICLRLWTTEISIFCLKENIEDYKHCWMIHSQ